MMVNMLNIRISAGLRPALAASSRIAATRGAMILADGPDMNTHSACSAANCRPRGEVPGLIKHGSALRRRLAQVNRVDPIVVSLVPDTMDLGGIGEDAAGTIPQCGVVLPASFPELVDHLHVFVGDGVTVVVRRLLVLAGAATGAVEIA